MNTAIVMNTPVTLNDDELAAVAGGFLNFTNSVNGNLGSFALNSNNNSWNHSFNTILSGNSITL